MLSAKSIEGPKEMIDQAMLRNCVLIDITSHYKHLKGKPII